jgi:DNA polymerase-1
MKKPRTLLIDADVPCYQLAFKNQTNIDWDDDGNESIYTEPEHLQPDIDSFIEGLCEKFNTSEVVIALSDTERSYRKELEPTYKSNRKAEKPKLWQMARDYLEHGDHGHTVKIKSGLEGDDILGIMATHPKWKDNHVVCTIDKDLQTVPCNLYLFNKPDAGVVPVTQEFASWFFMLQVLCGDTVDGYKGCPGIGIKRAIPILEDANMYVDRVGRNYWEMIKLTYESKGLTEDDAIHQARLAYILQYGDFNNKTGEVKLWTP